MKMVMRGFVTCVAVVLLADAAVAQGLRPLRRCAADAVIAGTVCMDKYEASVWRVTDPLGTGAKLVDAIQLGRATEAALMAGATQLGIAGEDYSCGDDGQDCPDHIYAVSLPGLMPSAYITWFQAQEACANSRKRLPSNVEWQAAVDGTPDPGPDDGSTDCNTNSAMAAVNTGSRSSCVSYRGAFDMVGNLEEWVADWVPRPTGCTGWDSFSDDYMCLSGASETEYGPGALLRGGMFGFFFLGPESGPLSVGGLKPSDAGSNIGFRCAR